MEVYKGNPLGQTRMLKVTILTPGSVVVQSQQRYDPQKEIEYHFWFQEDNWAFWETLDGRIIEETEL